MNYNIPVRLAKLHKHQTDIIKELRKRGIRVSQSEFSLWVNGVEDPPRSEGVMKAADEIVTEWEAEDARMRKTKQSHCSSR